MNKNYLIYLESESYSSLTIKNYSKYIDMALQFINKEENNITSMDIVSWINTFTNLKPNSQNIRISAVKSYFSFLNSFGFIDNDPCQTIKKKRLENVM